jgi:hypothetical protein
MNRNVSSSPGLMPAMNKRPIEVSDAMPYRIIVMLGGIRMPSVPPAAIAPVARSAS